MDRSLYGNTHQMAACPGRPNTRARAREWYRDRNCVEEKWLDQYGNMSLHGDYSRNQSCLQETFNLVDIVMENTINDYIRTNTPLKVRKEVYKTWYVYRNRQGETFAFYYPTTFAARTTVLRQMGYPISRKVDAVRRLRNETAHGNRTVVLQNRVLDYEVIRNALTALADVLILTGMLDACLREPSFDRMRVREGDLLQKGAYTAGTLLGENGMGRVYAGIQKHMDREVAVVELKPDLYSQEQILCESDVLRFFQADRLLHVYDVFFENGTYYIIMNVTDGIALMSRKVRSRATGHGRILAKAAAVIRTVILAGSAAVDMT